MILVLIADDHAILRRGLKQILSETEDMTVAGEAENSQQALQLVRDAEWDVVLLDISMPDRNGIDTLKLIKKEKPKLAVLLLSMHPENQYAIRALKAGASGYLTKQSAPAQLVTAIRQVKQGRIPDNPKGKPNPKWSDYPVCVRYILLELGWKHIKTKKKDWPLYTFREKKLGKVVNLTFLGGQNAAVSRDMGKARRY